ncbi:hypothetical protein [Pseudomonas sp. FEN]|nr:hypothetical protein [Pseudomonas sp. FEN]
MLQAAPVGHATAGDPGDRLAVLGQCLDVEADPIGAGQRLGKGRRFDPALCRPIWNPSARTSSIAWGNASCKVGSPPLKTTASSKPWRRCRKARTWRQSTSSLPRGAINCGLWQ